MIFMNAPFPDNVNFCYIAEKYTFVKTNTENSTSPESMCLAYNKKIKNSIEKKFTLEIKG